MKKAVSRDSKTDSQVSGAKVTQRVKELRAGVEQDGCVVHRFYDEKCKWCRDLLKQTRKGKL